MANKNRLLHRDHRLSPSIIADVFTKKTALLTVRRIKDLKELS